MKIYVALDKDFDDVVAIALNPDKLEEELYDMSFGEFHYDIYECNLISTLNLNTNNIKEQGKIIKEVTT